MLITQQLNWPVTVWPAALNATQYTVFQIYPAPVTALQNVTTNNASLIYDDTASLVYQVRPSSGALGSLTVGPEITSYVIGYVPCRAWLRQKVRIALADRADSASNATLLWPDDELNQYIQEAFGEFSILFPVEEDTTITLLPPTTDSFGNVLGVRNYTMPTDFYYVQTVAYAMNNGHQPFFLKEKPWKGGESMSNISLGYTKLGILVSQTGGRSYPGHFQIYEGQIQLDFDPFGTGDQLRVNYLGRRPTPVGDADLFTDITPEDMELLSLYTQMKCWLRVEGNDTRLSRWRGNPDGSNRDGMPTVKHSTIMKNLYNERVNDRHEMRPRVLRLVRR